MPGLFLFCPLSAIVIPVQAEIQRSGHKPFCATEDTEITEVRGGSFSSVCSVPSVANPLHPARFRGIAPPWVPR